MFALGLVLKVIIDKSVARWSEPFWVFLRGVSEKFGSSGFERER